MKHKENRTRTLVLTQDEFNELVDICIHFNNTGNDRGGVFSPDHFVTANTIVGFG